MDFVLDTAAKSLKYFFKFS